MSTAYSLEELHQFFEDDPDDYRLEIDAEVRLKALYSCLVNATSRTTLQIGLNGLLTYVKASQRSSIIDELLLSKDYISEIIAIAADHFTSAPFLSATCLCECMINYPKQFSPFLINKFRPKLPRIIYRKQPGPNEICCKCIAHSSVLGIPSSVKQAKSWKTEYDHYLKIASLLLDQLYFGINELLNPDINDIETALISEIGDIISSNHYAEIFSNCCHILNYLFYVKLDSPVTVPAERTFKLITKIMSINNQQFNILHRKQFLPTLLSSCIRLCDTLLNFNSSSFMFNIRSIFTLIITLLDIVRPQAEYLTLSIGIYKLLTNLFALFHRQVRIDVDILQKLIRWIINDSTIRVKSKIPVSYISKSDYNLCSAALNCNQQLINIYSDHMPKDQYNLIQNHIIQTIMACQTTNSIISKPYDNELCRVGLYNSLECLLINERADCSTIIAISKNLIDNANLSDSSIQVKMVLRKLKLIWQQIHDSTNHLYQPWSYINIDKPRKSPSNNINSSIIANDFQNTFVTSSMPIMNNMQSTINTESTILINSNVHTKTLTYQTHIDMPVQPTPNTSHDLLATPQENNLETFALPITEENQKEFNKPSQQPAKRIKIIDTRPVEITDEEDNDDDDGAEQIFFTKKGDKEHENDHPMVESDDDDDEIESEEMDESDEVDDDGDDDQSISDVISEDDNEQLIQTNGIGKHHQHNLDLHQSNVDLLAPHGDAYLQTMNDNIHKKFRRQNHLDQQYSSFDSVSADISHNNNNNNNNEFYSSVQLNGDYKTNLNKQIVSNGQLTSTNNTRAHNNENDDDDDDDDIVLVSDDDSQEKQSDSKEKHMPSLEINREISTSNEDASTPNLLENNDKCLNSNNVNTETASLTLAVQETIDAIRDSICLASTDYKMSNDEID